MGDAYWTKPALVLMGLWGAGSGMILWLAGLKGIPRTLYEAASIDGASPGQQFGAITLPMLSPLIFFNLVMGLIGSVQVFDSVYIITKGEGAGPNDSLLMPVYHLFINGFTYFRMGYASALAWVIFAIILAITAVQFFLSKKWVYTEVAK
jgi:ABC-type sugar transport system permease subunit